MDAGGAARPGRARRSRSMVGRAAADRAQAARSRRLPRWPTRSPTAPRRRRTRITAPSSNSPPAGSRCASCTSRRWRWRISPASPKASPIRSRWRARIYWQGRAAEALGPRRRRRAAYYEAAARYPTAYYGQLARAQLAPRRRHAARVAAAAAPNAARSKSRRVFEILYAIDERDIVASMAADIADKATDAAGAGDARRDHRPPQRCARDAADRQDRARPRFSVRAIRVPGFRRAGLPADRAGRSSAAWSIRSCGRKAPSTPRSSPAPMRLA